MKKVQNGAGTDSALDELYERHGDRTRTFDRSPEYAEQRSRELLNRSMMTESYDLSDSDAHNIQNFKKNAEGKRRLVTERDFASSYRASREYIPEANVELDSIVYLEKMEQDEYIRATKALKKENKDLRAGALSNKKSEPRKKTDTPAKKTSEHLKRAVKETAKTWIPLEERHKERMVEGSKTKLPTGTILAILVITVSLLLIVGSAVLLLGAEREQNELESMLSRLDSQIAELEDELERKNEYADIDIYADEHGMISNEHINVEYINTNRTDGVETDASSGFSLSDLIKWFFSDLR